MPTVVVSAVPAGVESREGARFVLRDGAPLRIGPSREARLSAAGKDGDVLVTASGDVVRVSTPGRTVRATVNGEAMLVDADRVLTPLDTLYVEPGWALRLAPVAAMPPGLDVLERRLIDQPDDDASWAVYADALLEAGVPLGDWLRRTGSTLESMRILGTLAEPVMRGQLRVTWNRFGMVTSARLTRAGYRGSPGSEWIYEALAREPVCRLMRRFSAEQLIGQPLVGGEEAQALGDVVLAKAVERIAQMPWARSLESVTFGYVDEAFALGLTRVAVGELQRASPRLQVTAGQLLANGKHGSLEVVEIPPEVSLPGLAQGDVRRLIVGRTEIGSSVYARLRVLGPFLPATVCTVTNAGGQWSVGAMGYPVQLDGQRVQTALLLPGDIIEPWPGLKLRFRLEPWP